MLESIPHGGKLINRILRGKDREMAELKARELRKIPLTSREVSDLEMMAVGALSPLEGFMCKDDYHSVIDTYETHERSSMVFTCNIICFSGNRR